MSKHIFPHFYSLEAPVLWRPHRGKLTLSRKHFRNAFLMKSTGRLLSYYTAGRDKGFQVTDRYNLVRHDQWRR
jgi:hypothetical protein